MCPAWYGKCSENIATVGIYRKEGGDTLMPTRQLALLQLRKPGTHPEDLLREILLHFTQNGWPAAGMEDDSLADLE